VRLDVIITDACKSQYGTTGAAGRDGYQYRWDFGDGTICDGKTVTAILYMAGFRLGL